MNAPQMKRIDARAAANPWVRYEQLKQQLPKHLTSAEYQAACTALAKICRV